MGSLLVERAGRGLGCSEKGATVSIRWSDRQIETGTDDLLARVEEGVAYLIMNRPERRNALSGGMLKGLDIALADAERSPDVGCVVLTPSKIRVGDPRLGTLSLARCSASVAA